MFAPEVLTHQGRILVISLWVVVGSVMLYGGYRVETNFTMEFFIPPDSNVDKFYKLDITYF